MSFPQKTYHPRESLTHVAFVDAGYLRDIGAKLHGVDVADVRIEPVDLLAACRMSSHGIFLRAYVYDGQFDVDHERRPQQTVDHEYLADEPGLRLRLGVLRPRRHGVEQKGVDTLLVLDMLQMAQVRAFDVALLIAGDSDFVDVVDAVQRLGRRVDIATDERSTGLARTLRQSADVLQAIHDPLLREVVRPR